MKTVSNLVRVSLCALAGAALWNCSSDAAPPGEIASEAGVIDDASTAPADASAPADDDGAAASDGSVADGSVAVTRDSLLAAYLASSEHQLVDCKPDSVHYTDLVKAKLTASFDASYYGAGTTAEFHASMQACFASLMLTCSPNTPECLALDAFAGTSPLGTACDIGQQCLTGACSAAKDSSCKTCVAALGLGASCKGKDGACGTGLFCSADSPFSDATRACLKRALVADGASCSNTANVCGPGSSCQTRESLSVCVADVALDKPCTAESQLDRIGCSNPGTTFCAAPKTYPPYAYTCQSLPVAGEKCATGGVDRWCSAGFVCDPDTNLCRLPLANIADNDRCFPGDLCAGPGSSCAPSGLLQWQCKKQPLAGEPCNDNEMAKCVDGFMCNTTSKKCEANPVCN